uniref:AIP3 domain-containing protein n=1 Tax=Caenorhabditis tropicalis TaxID=1561998 RepID=A0A1I7TJA3_9PELO
MSRHPPLVTKKEIIYRRSFIDDHNDRFEKVMRNPASYSPREPKSEQPRNVVVSHNYHSDVESEVSFVFAHVSKFTFYHPIQYQLSKINKKLDRIIEILRSPSIKRNGEEQEHVVVDAGRQEQTRQYKDICERLDKLETELTGRTHFIAPIQSEIHDLTKKVHELAQIQEDLKEKLIASNIAGDDIDELLRVINETRRDMEEKIGNIKQLSDGNYIHLEDKLDGYLRNQHGIQLQVDHLMHLLTHSSRPASASGSRPASVADKASTVSRSSSKSSNLKANLVVPTRRSPPPKAPTSHKSASTITSSTTLTSLDSAKKEGLPVDAPPKPPRSPAIEVLEKTKSIETLNEIHNAQKLENESISSGSYIAPLAIDGRRNSQPANIFHTKKY